MPVLPGNHTEISHYAGNNSNTTTYYQNGTSVLGEHFNSAIIRKSDGGDGDGSDGTTTGSSGGAAIAGTHTGAAVARRPPSKLTYAVAGLAITAALQLALSGPGR